MIASKARPAVPADIEAMHRVRMSVRENRLVSTVISVADYRAHMEPPARSWVIDVAGEIVAFAAGNAQSGNVWALFVHPDHEGRGYGRALHDALVEWMWSQGATRLTLTTAPDTRAQRFYETAGWSRAGIAGGELRFELCRPEAAAP